MNVTPLLASAGIVTAAVALASKDTLANFFGGVSIFVDRPYRLRDYIILESGERGEVVNIGIRSTRILTRDDVLITVPNAVLANSKIINQSGQVPRYRIRAKVGVGYGSDVDKVEEVLLTACEGLKRNSAHAQAQGALSGVRGFGPFVRVALLGARSGRPGPACCMKSTATSTKSWVPRALKFPFPKGWCISRRERKSTRIFRKNKF